VHQVWLETRGEGASHPKARYASAIALLLLISHAHPAIAGETQGETRPPAYLHCELKVGEHSVLKGPCRVTTLKGSRILIEDEGEAGITLLAVPENERDRIFWNDGNRGRAPKKLLGVGQWLDNCWRGVANSEPSFYLCLVAKTTDGASL
jgi:hypothetical protein